MRKSRRVAKQSPVRGTYYVYSNYSDTVAALESELELDYFDLLNFERNVELFIPQPGSIWYNVNGHTRRYSPDFKVIKNGVTYIDEIKYESELTSNEALETKFRILRKYYRKQGKVFRVLTDKDIHHGKRADNLTYLRPMLLHPTPQQEMDELKQALPCTRTASIYELQDHLSKLGLDPGLCRRAIAHKLMHCDLTLPWDSLQLSW